MADSINIVVPKAATDSIIKTGIEIIKLDGAYMKLLKNIESGQAMLKSQGTSFEKLNKHKNNAKKITKDLTTLEKERIKIQNQTKTATAQITIATEKETKALAKKKLTLQENRKETKLNIVANRALKGSVEQISASLSKNIIKWKKLSAHERDNTKAGKQLTATIKKQELALQRLNGQLGRSQRKVGSYKASILSAGKSLMMVAGVGGGLFMLVRGLGSVIKKYTAFEHIMSKVKAVASPTNVEFNKLRNQAKMLGESTEKTASQVAGLQVNLSKLGLSAKDILLATGAILDLSTAADADLGQAATTAAATLKGFGLKAKEMTRVTDVMALSFSSSALDLEKFTNSMNKIAPIAKNANISLETSTAYLSLLVDRGIEASTAGTSLRKMFLELSKQGLSWNDAMGMINDATDKNKRALEIFGIRAATAAVILAANSKEAELLSKKYEGAAGSAKKMADVMRDNLKGDADKARSALEGLSINLGTKLAPTLRSVTQGFTSFIGFLNKGVKSFSDLNKYNSELSKSLTNTAGEVEKNGIEIDTLTTKYEDLIKIVDPTKTQQEELETVIRNIVKIVPDAATEIDNYGRVLKINTGFAKGFVKEQKEILAELAELTMPDIVSDLAETTKEINKLENELRIGRETTLGAYEKLTKVEQIQNELSIKNLKNRKDLTLDILNSSGIEENKIVNAFADEFSKSEIHLRNKLINIIRNFYITKRIEAKNAEDEEAKATAEEKAAAAKVAADILLADEKALQDKLFTFRKKHKLISDEELFNIEKEQLEKSKYFVLLKEKEKLWLIHLLRKKYNLLPIDIEYFESLSELKRGAKKETEEFLMEEEEMYDDEAVYLANKWKESLEGKYALNEAFYKAGIKSEAEYNDTILELGEERNAKELEMEEAKKEAKWVLALALSDALFSIFSSRLEAQMQSNEAERARELKAAGDDADLKDKINQKYDIEQNKLRTKQAKAEKKQAIFSILISTAQAIAKASPAIPLMIFAALVGALQLAIVAARPIPKFKHGTKGKHDTPDTFITSEKGAGTEWTEIAGKIIQTDKPTLHTNSEGARIYSNKEIQKLIANDKVGFDSKEIINALGENSKVITKAIRNQKQLIIEQGKVIGYQQDGYTRKYIERMIE